MEDGCWERYVRIMTVTPVPPEDPRDGVTHRNIFLSPGQIRYITGSICRCQIAPRSLSLTLSRPLLIMRIEALSLPHIAYKKSTRGSGESAARPSRIVGA